MNLRHACVAVGLVLAQVLTSAPAAPSSSPNVVFILADDLGYGDVKSFGQDRCQIDTPHFDQLAREGMRLTQAYSVGSVCVPSRIGIMTGRYAWRFGRSGPGGPWGFLGTKLAEDQPTLGTLMQSAGYRTGYIGKWHLGTLMPTTNGKPQNTDNVDYAQPLTIGPAQYGFNESFILPGSLDMYPYAFVRDNRWVGNVTAQKGWSAFHRVGPAAEDFEDVKVLDTFCTEAEQFMQRHVNAANDRPFFLYLALTSPHTPLSPSTGFAGRSRLGVYGDFVMETDHCVGRMLSALERLDLTEHTLVIVSSDHGAAPYAGRNRQATNGQMKQLEQDGHYASGPFRGYKFSVYEGGFRVPFVVRWPNQVAAGATCERIVGLHDLMATLADVVNHELGETEAPDSISMLPLLRDAEAEAPRTSIILQATQGMAIRSGRWKLAFCPGSGCSDQWLIAPGSQQAWRTARTAYGKPPRDRGELLHPAFVQLFDLGQDPAETTNLAASHPRKLRELHQLFDRQVRSGRSTPGPALDNDRAPQRAFTSVPAFVWE